MASVLIVLDAVDVAMTEAAVGAGVSTVLLLATLHLTKSMEYPQPRKAYLPLFVAVGTGAAIVWGTYSLPPFGTRRQRHPQARRAPLPRPTPSRRRWFPTS